MNINDVSRSRESVVAYAFENDFLALQRIFALPDIHYSDISQNERLSAALQRWPLLAEFAEKKQG